MEGSSGSVSFWVFFGRSLFNSTRWEWPSGRQTLWSQWWFPKVLVTHLGAAELWKLLFYFLRKVRIPFLKVCIQKTSGFCKLHKKLGFGFVSGREFLYPGELALILLGNKAYRGCSGLPWMLRLTVDAQAYCGCSPVFSSHRLACGLVCAPSPRFSHPVWTWEIN